MSEDRERYEVYRCYDPSGRLIYVGCTRNLTNRLRQHRYRSWWGRSIARFESETVLGKIAARALEKAQISAYAPAFNDDHNGGRRQCRPLTDTTSDFIPMRDAAADFGATMTTFTRTMQRRGVQAYRVPGFKCRFIRRQDLETLRTPVAVQR